MAQSKCSEEVVPTTTITLIDGSSNPRGTSYELSRQGGWKGTVGIGKELAKVLYLSYHKSPEDSAQD